MEEKTSSSFNKLLAEMGSSRKAFALYRRPGEKEMQFCGGGLQEVHEGIELSEGFVFSAFLSADTLYRITPEFSFTLPDKERFFVDVKAPLYLNRKPSVQDDKAYFTNLVKDAVNNIREGEFKKVVLSRTKSISLKKSFSAFTLFYRLCHTYPNAFVFLLSAEEFGSWVCCTPELLLRKEGKIVSTVALAGTRAIEDGQQASVDVLFTDKELREQDLVSVYIRQVLKSFAKNVKISEPGIKKAGNVYHIYTEFSAELDAEYRANVLPLLFALHPTPAVCGLPLQPSKSYILNRENYHREMYSGFAGLADEHGNADIYVNLRCLQLFDHSALLYAGAGIVDGSDAEKEWEETEHKMDTLLNVIQKNG